MLSTHLIDGWPTCSSSVMVVDQGRVVIDAEAEDVRGTAYTVVGPVRPVAEALSGGGARSWHAEDVGAYASATVA